MSKVFVISSIPIACQKSLEIKSQKQ